MKLEEQVCSLELAKRLKELGVKQESLWYYKVLGKNCHKGDTLTLDQKGNIEGQVKPDEESFFILNNMLDEDDFKDNDLYSAFTVAELGEMLKNCCDVDYWYSYPDWRLKHAKNIDSDGRDKLESNARAKMLIYLLENELKSKEHKK